MKRNQSNVLIAENNLSQKVDLKLDWATYEAAKYACENWHYSKSVPVGKLVKIGAWENNKYIGPVIYSYGANNNACKGFELTQQQVCELTRVALNQHKTPVSRILSVSLKILNKQSPGLKLCFSYADKTNQEHHGGIYQANGWIYLGERKTSDKGAYYIILGKKMHGRSARAKYGNETKFPKGWSHVASQTKHLYVKIFDPNFKLKCKTMKYPKRATSKDNVASGVQPEEGGAIPTVALQGLVNG